MIPRFLPLVLAGCPYVFGPPDLANVGDGPPADADADTDTDIDTDTDTDADTDTDTEPNGTAPTIALATPSLTVHALTLEISVIDPDGDLISGSLALFDGDVELAVWSVPSQFVLWEPAGISIVEYYASLPCEGWAPELSLRMTDFAGNTSAPFPLPYTVAGVTVAAGVNTRALVDVADVPFTWCSTADWIDDPLTPPPAETERDIVTFANPVSAPLLVTVNWDPADVVDIDLLVNGDAGGPPAYDYAADTFGLASAISYDDDVAGEAIDVEVFPYQAANNAPDPDGPWDYQVLVQAAP